MKTPLCGPIQTPQRQRRQRVTPNRRAEHTGAAALGGAVSDISGLEGEVAISVTVTVVTARHSHCIGLLPRASVTASGSHRAFLSLRKILTTYDWLVDAQITVAGSGLCDGLGLGAWI
ncbi:hypothetical protein V500_05520 [Pseudogymnoascus sp. VKM F-4518 (FW-2643)]|nr:hypothetical protein V500_05520 [Pseudogymnoascus sp. VKM F-4518 (FW-2643)]